MRRHHQQEIVRQVVAVESRDGFLLGIDGFDDKLVVLPDISSFALRIHPDDRVVRLPRRLSLPSKELEAYPIAYSPLFEIDIQQPLRLVRRRRATVRAKRNTDENAAAVEGLERVPQAQGRIHLPGVVRALFKAGN